MLAADGSGSEERGIELDVLDESFGFDLRVSKRFALFARQQHGDFVEPLTSELRAFHQDLGTLLRQRIGPAAEGRVGGVDRLAGLLDASLRHRVDEFTGRGVVNLEGRARPRGRRLAVDDHRAHVLLVLQ